MAETKAKHTPGPWDYFVGNANGRGLIRIETPHYAEVAGIHIASMTRGDVSEANARLIAAAPDLDAAACLAITALSFEQERAQRDGDAVALAQITQAKNALIAAQNKARGREAEMIDVTPPAAIAKAEG